MAVRTIDGNAVKRRAWDIADAWKRQGRDYEALLLEFAVEQIVDTTPTLTPPNEPRMINADKLAKRIAGHSNYHGDSILAAIYCAAESKESDIPIQPIETPPNEWVSVEERLPYNHGEYIVCVCDEDESIDEQIWGDTVVVFADYYDGTFTWYEGDEEYDISDIVTHWMPLLEPPPRPRDRRTPEQF